MHSRTIKSTLHSYMRVGIFAASLAGGAVADGMGPTHPMSGACFLHDSGLEYIPNRILGREDVAFTSDRADNERWTCTDPFADCVFHAVRRDQQVAATEAWDRAFSVGKMLRTWTQDAVAEATVQSLRQWHASLVGFGKILGERFSIDSNPDPDCPWDRIAYLASMPCSDLAPQSDTILREHANIFVFTLGMKLACQPIAESPEETSSPAPTAVASPSDRPLIGLAGRAFARDYCVFAPYPLDDAYGVSSPLREAEPKNVDIDSDERPESGSVLRLQQLAAVRLQRSASRELARDMNWLGHALIQWSSQLESSVRIAEAKEGPWMDELK